MLIKVRSRGRITLPKALREAMNIKLGDLVTLTPVDDFLMIRPATESLSDDDTISVDKSQDFVTIRKEGEQRPAKNAIDSQE